jgi:hypothetical protein
LTLFAIFPFVPPTLVTLLPLLGFSDISTVTLFSPALLFSLQASLPSYFFSLLFCSWDSLVWYFSRRLSYRIVFGSSACPD